MSVRACLNCGAKFGVRCVDDRCCERDDREAAFVRAERCTEIADRIAPGALARGCVGWKPKIWQGAWDGACIALGGDPKDHRA